MLALMLGCGSCASHIASVDQRMILPQSDNRYELDPRQAFIYPSPMDNASPAFPETFDQRDLPPTVVCARLSISEHGVVTDAAALHQEGECGSQATDIGLQLEQAVLATLRLWRFEPASICTYPDLASKEQDKNETGCNGEDVTATQVAVSLGYAFTFEIANGKRKVDAKRTR
ncbi:MAG TPA: hypothetical protein VFH12_06535 [Pseudoxanthomonas sp.]|nr:hypothetical protein [Pseudoxanthomonas sp.]